MNVEDKRKSTHDLWRDIGHFRHALNRRVDKFGKQQDNDYIERRIVEMECELRRRETMKAEKGHDQS